MAKCYVCGNKSITFICENCQQVQGISSPPVENDFAEDEPTTQPMFDLSDFKDKDFAADDEGAVINVDRWNLLEALYDECRTIRENLVAQGGGSYKVKDSDLTDFFVLLDELENL